MREFEQYTHRYTGGGEALVWVDKALKGKHREHCLCWACHYFTPGQEGSCRVASILFSVCQAFDLVTPVYECPTFRESVRGETLLYRPADLEKAGLTPEELISYARTSQEPPHED